VGSVQLVFLGPPGAGKGTQAAILARELGIPQISTGDMFRAAVRDQTPLGREAQRYMEAGQLVPDEVTIGIVEERLRADDCREGFILDGFPRTVAQAEALDRILAAAGRPLEWAVEFVIGEEEVVRRLAGRRTCPRCGAVYNVYTQPPQREGRCDRCGEPLVQREDDREETVRARLAVYRRQTAPLVDFYEAGGRLVRIDASRAPGEVTAALKEALGLA
jgi:adenylate kinase